MSSRLTKGGDASRNWRLPLAITGVALCLRCIYVWQVQQAPFAELRLGDAAAYHEWAKRIAGGDWVGSGVFYQAPLYPYLLAVFYKIFGDGVAGVRLAQAVAGAVSCALLARAGMALFDRRGAVAGLLLAIYPAAIYYDGLLEKSALVTLLTAGLLASLSIAAEEMTSRRLIAAGAVLGLLTLARENALILAVPALLWVALSVGVAERRARIARVAAFAAGTVVVLLPVGIRNYAVGGEFHLTTSQSGPNFYIGNHEGAKGTYEGLVRGHGNAADEREDATMLAEQALGRKLSAGEVSSYWTGRSLDYMKSQPMAWLALTVKKLALTVNASELPDTESPSVYAEHSWLLRTLQPFHSGVLFALAAFGAVVTARSWRRVWFLYAFAGAYAASVALFYVFGRYRFPLVPILALLAAGGIAEGTRRWRTHGLRSLWPAGAAAVAALIVAYLPFDDPRGAKATHYLNIAIALATDPARADDAMAYYKRAVDEAPPFPPAQFGIGVLLSRQGRAQEAIGYYKAAVEAWPSYAEARYDLGLTLGEVGRWEEAAAEYQVALRLGPRDIDTRLAYGKALTALQRPAEALEQYRIALEARPRDVTALVGAGVALTQSGRAEEAIRHYTRAIEIDPRSAQAHNNLGWTLASAGRIAEAVPHFERALEIDPRYESARANLEQARRALAGK